MIYLTLPNISGENVSHLMPQIYSLLHTLTPRPEPGFFKSLSRWALGNEHIYVGYADSIITVSMKCPTKAMIHQLIDILMGLLCRTDKEKWSILTGKFTVEDKQIEGTYFELIDTLLNYSRAIPA